MNEMNTNMVVITNNSLTRLESSIFEGLIRQIIKSELKIHPVTHKRRPARIYPQVFDFYESKLLSFLF